MTDPGHIQDTLDDAVATTSVTSPDTIANDLLHGAERIGEFLGINRRRAFYLLEHGHIPGFKLGKQWCARRSQLNTTIRAQDKGDGIT